MIDQGQFVSIVLIARLVEIYEQGFIVLLRNVKCDLTGFIQRFTFT